MIGTVFRQMECPYARDIHRQGARGPRGPEPNDSWGQCWRTVTRAVPAGADDPSAAGRPPQARIRPTGRGDAPLRADAEDARPELPLFGQVGVAPPRLPGAARLRAGVGPAGVRGY